jgi:hypothetical protein
MAQFFYSKITICSASTFCFWPALASSMYSNNNNINNNNHHTIIYYPVTQNILNGKQFFFSKNFNWITVPKISQKKNDETVENFLIRLSSYHRVEDFDN